MRTLCLVTTMSLLFAAGARANQATPATPDRPRVAIFFDAGFPAIDAPPPDLAALRTALAAFDVTVLDSPALRAALEAGRVDVLVLPFGSAFPQDAWPAIFDFLARGGNFVNLGGAPFAVPVIGGRGAWHPATRTTSYFKQLGIVQAFPVAASGLVFHAADDKDDGMRSLAAAARGHRIFELIVRFTSTKAFPDEDGSDGPREARLLPLVHGFGTREGDGAVPLAAPFVQIDRLDGPFAGGTWLFATGDLGVSTPAVATLVGRAVAGAGELTVQPRYAGFHPGEPIEVTVTLRCPSAGAATGSAGLRADVQVDDGSDRTVTSVSAMLEGSAPLLSARVTLPVDSAGLARGLYRLRAVVQVGPFDSRTTARALAQGRQVGRRFDATSGFWIYDASMLRGGRPVAAGRDYFTRDGVPFPVAGTTYMATDVHRRFLLEPNPWLWRQDFAAMAQAGVNMVRAGIWTAWSLHSESDGRPTEGMLRSLEVFLMTARRHDIPLVFTFFAFVPPTWGGGNAYFDPRALEAQRRFAGGIAGRLADANDVIWDLINEPSFSSADRLWLCRPNYDADEQAAWEAWLRRQVPGGDEATREARLLERWNAVGGEGLTLPALHDFRDAHLFALARPNKAADYRRFAQEAFAGWVRDISTAIRANGNRAQLITVGQDEGGSGERPNPLLFGGDVDFTVTHTWWNNDALLWDGLMSKRADRPALVEETGLMTYERPDGGAWRDEEDERNLLERKIALAMGSGGAGFVQWLWNTNVYMPIDNEAGIGFLRADGTAKPEIEPFVRAAAFLRSHRDRFAGRALEDVVIVVPQSAVFSVRDQGTPAVQQAVRTLEYELRVPVRIVSEYAVADLRQGARLLVLPSPRVLTEPAWTALLSAVDAGSVLLVTGPIDRDEYERPLERLAALGVHATTRPVAPESRLLVGTSAVRVPFRGGKLERIERAVVGPSQPARVQVVRHGKGSIVWCPLPVEVSDDGRAVSTVYRFALGLAGVRPAVSVSAARQVGSGTASVAQAIGRAAGDGILVRPLRFTDSVLLVVVNETDTDADLRIKVEGLARPVPVHVAAERAIMLLVDRKTGAVAGATNPSTRFARSGQATNDRD